MVRGALGREYGLVLASPIIANVALKTYAAATGDSSMEAFANQVSCVSGGAIYGTALLVNCYYSEEKYAEKN